MNRTLKKPSPLGITNVGGGADDVDDGGGGVDDDDVNEIHAFVLQGYKARNNNEN